MRAGLRVRAGPKGRRWVQATMGIGVPFLSPSPEHCASFSVKGSDQRSHDCLHSKAIIIVIFIPPKCIMMV